MDSQQERGHLYIIESEEGPIKIGISSDPATRIDAIRRASGRTFKRQFVSPAMPYYGRLEMLMHEQFKSSRTVGEWFEAPFEEAFRMAHLLGATVDPAVWMSTDRYVRGAIARERLIAFCGVDRNELEIRAFVAGMGQESFDETRYADEVDRVLMLRMAEKCDNAVARLHDSVASLGVSISGEPSPWLLQRRDEIAREVRALLIEEGLMPGGLVSRS